MSRKEAWRQKCALLLGSCAKEDECTRNPPALNLSLLPPSVPPPPLQVRELFNPDYGMFTVDERTHLHWFRPSLEATSSSEDLLDLDLEYELVGILIGE